MCVLRSNKDIILFLNLAFLETNSFKRGFLVPHKGYLSMQLHEQQFGFISPDPSLPVRLSLGNSRLLSMFESKSYSYRVVTECR